MGSNASRLRSAALVGIALLLGSGCPAAAPTAADPVAASPPPPPTGRTLRYLSLAIRDVPPSLEETTAFLAGERSLDSFTAEWFASPEHERRVRRYFADFFGLTVGFTPFDSFLLVKNDAGVYRLPNKPDCTLAEAVSAPAWWLDEGDTILICPTSTSDEVVCPVEDPVVAAECALFHVPGDTGDGCSVLCNATANQELDPRCGCGREQLLCMPCEPTGSASAACEPSNARNREVERDFNQESVERGLFAYQENLSWLDYLGGDFFYGPRPLYLFYLLGQGQLYSGELSGAQAITQLRAIPMDRPGRAPWPLGRIPRAGIVTSPGYMNAYNTTRGRARALSQRLLCHDVDERLNIDNFSEYVNPGHSQVDRDHGSDPRCNYCHYGMDNQAGMLFGYEIDGTSQFSNAPIPVPTGSPWKCCRLKRA